jgi:hypothetical protein
MIAAQRVRARAHLVAVGDPVGVRVAPGGDRRARAEGSCGALDKEEKQ